MLFSVFSLIVSPKPTDAAARSASERPQPANDSIAAVTLVSMAMRVLRISEITPCFSATSLSQLALVTKFLNLGTLTGSGSR
ncbi:hypothetical protein WK62_13085 [Burkholderia ubonensis]|nr:hypothetical protein WK62_13085 [Burkholderia ubonensis]